MDERIYREYVAILKEELQPAMGCTEPIAVAYCAALAHRTLGALPENGRGAREREHHQKRQERRCAEHGRPAGHCGGRSGGHRGRRCRRAAAGACEPHAGAGGCRWAPICSRLPLPSGASDKDYVFDIQVRVTAAGGQRVRRDRGLSHERDPYLRKTASCCFDKDYHGVTGSQHATDRSLLTVEHIVAVCRRGGHCRRAGDARSGRSTATRPSPRRACAGHWGANIGRILLQSYGDEHPQPGQGLRRRRVGRPDERLRPAGGHQLRQRQPGADGIAAGHRLRPGNWASTQEMLYRALRGVEPRHHPPENRHRQPVRLLRRHRRPAAARPRA